ncbi:hypothetical protein L6R52_37170, partial [Myxococcota bacterium]|nr:hypothetical protein [Myxococcota bacterium]
MTHEPKRWRDLSHGTGTPEQAAARLVASVEAPRIPAAARARVFTRLATSIDRRPSRRPVVWGVAGAVMGALAVLVSLRMSPVIELEAPRGIAALTSASGAVQVAARGGALEDAALGRAIAGGERVVAVEGTASVALFGAGDLTLRAGTELVLDAEGTSDLVVAELTRGTISVATQLAAPARRVVVRAADHRIEASSGARATITHTPPTGLVIEVAEGSVDVTSSKGRTRVDAGRRYDAGEARADRGAHDSIEGAVITPETSARDEVAEPTRAEPEAHAEAEVTEVPPS